LDKSDQSLEKIAAKSTGFFSMYGHAETPLKTE